MKEPTREHPIRRKRLDARLSMRELGAAVGVSTRSIASYEIEGVEPSLRTAKRIAQVLGCTVDDLVAEDEQPEAIVA